MIFYIVSYYNVQCPSSYFYTNQYGFDRHEFGNTKAGKGL